MGLEPSIYNFLKETSGLLQSFRYTIDRLTRFKEKLDKKQFSRVTQSILLIEESRIVVDYFIRGNSDDLNDGWEEIRLHLIQFVEKFLMQEDIGPQITDRKLLLHPLYRRDIDNYSFLLKRIYIDNSYTIYNSLFLFRSILQEIRFQSNPNHKELTFVDLNKIVPEQKVSPVKFEIVNNVIGILKEKPKISPADSRNIAESLDHIQMNGARLISNLKNSNCDPRLVDSVIELHSFTLQDDNIIKIGLANLTCNIMSGQFKSELPDAIMGMFNAYTTSVSMYVAQFPEWEQFTQKALEIHINEEDIEDIRDSTDNLIKLLHDKSELSSPEVPKTIKFVKDFISSPTNMSKRSVFALIRTLENLVSVIIRYSLDFFSKTAQKSMEGLSTTASAAIIGMLGIALAGALSISPISAQTGAPWVNQAIEIVQKYIETYSK